MSLSSVAPINPITADLPTGSSSPSVSTTAAAALTATPPVPESFITIQDFAALFKALATGSVSRAQAALATVLSDLSAHAPASPATPNPAAALNSLIEKMQKSLLTGGTDSALHDLAAFVIRTTPTTGTMVNTTI